jgi:hypothetical protein
MCDVHGTQCLWPSAASSGTHDGSAYAPPRKRARRETEAVTEADAMATAVNAGYRTDTNNVEHTTGQLASTRRMMPEPGSTCVPNNPHHIVQDPGTLSDEEEHNAHVIGPVMANDTEILETYLSTVSEHSRRRRVQTASSRQARPVMFTTMPKKPLGTRQHQSLASCKCELIEKLLEPFSQDVIERQVRTCRTLTVFARC